MQFMNNASVRIISTPTIATRNMPIKKMGF
jgi:hypothetical protein